MTHPAVRRLAARLTPSADGEAAGRPVGVPVLRQAVVQAVAASTVDVLIAGSADPATVGWLGTRPVVGATVWVALTSGAGMVLGRQQAENSVWNTLTLGTNISAQGAPFDTPGYRLAADGRVWLRGVARTNAVIGAGATVATLPAGFRPPGQKVFAFEATAGALRFDVTTAGLITTSPGLGNATFFSLDGVSFETY